MSLEDIITDYITQQRSLGKRYTSEAITLEAFRRSVGDVPVRDIHPEMISRFVDRGATSMRLGARSIARWQVCFSLQSRAAC